MKTRRRLLPVLSFALAALMLSTPVSAARSKYFTDIEDNYSWASGAVDRLYEAYVVKGAGNGAYLPESRITRGDFMLMLIRAFRMKGETELNFSDVAQDSYYYEAVLTAKALGIAIGSGGMFSPSDGITRQDAMVLVSRTLAAAGMALSGTGGRAVGEFGDIARISGYAVDAVTEMVESGMIQGNGGLLNPAGGMSRAEMAVFLHRVMDATGMIVEREPFARGVDQETLAVLSLTEDQGSSLRTVLEYIGTSMLECGYAVIDGSPSLTTATNAIYSAVEGGLYKGLSSDLNSITVSNEQMGEIYRSIFAVGDLEKDASGRYLFDASVSGGSVAGNGDTIVFTRRTSSPTALWIQAYHGEGVSGGARVWCALWRAPLPGEEPVYYGRALVCLKSGNGLGGGFLVDSYEIFPESAE